MVLGAWLYRAGKHAEAARVLLPALDSLYRDEHLVEVTRHQLGELAGQRMLVAFAGDRDYEATLKYARQIDTLYPTAEKGDRSAFGYQGRLSLLHPDMVSVLVFFNAGATEGTPQHVAYLPRGRISARARGCYRCVPATLKAGVVSPRGDFAPYFDGQGLAALAQPAWT